MDRLLCGDVGFGKTEVALRAAFKCVMDGKQVRGAGAHHHPGLAALSDLPAAGWRASPCTVELLSRFRTPKEQKEILSEAASGARWTSSSAPTGCCPEGRAVQGSGPADHRRGAAVRRGPQGAVQGDARRNVDVLTLSATPIPRTLQHGHERHPGHERHRGGPPGPPPGADLCAGA